MFSYQILLVEDDEDDQLLFQEALQDCSPSALLEIKKNGVEALKFLSESALRVPHIIFVDLNMPIMDGWDLVPKIRSLSWCQRVPIIAYSSSSARRDITALLVGGANSYAVKPNSFKGLSNLIRTVIEEQPLF